MNVSFFINLECGKVSAAVEIIMQEKNFQSAFGHLHQSTLANFCGVSIWDPNPLSFSVDV